MKNGANLAVCQGVEVQTALSRGLPEEESRLSQGPSRSRAYGFVLGMVALFFFFFISRVLAVTIHLYALRVQAIDWLGRLLHQRKAANQSRTLAVSPCCKQLMW